MNANATLFQRSGMNFMDRILILKTRLKTLGICYYERFFCKNFCK